ncbi:hypothetical protein [Brevundimonas naejangsanensis]
MRKPLTPAAGAAAAAPAATPATTAPPPLCYRPYLSALLLQAGQALRDAAAADRLSVLVKAALEKKTSAAILKVVTRPGAAAQFDGLWITTITYRQTTIPSWMGPRATAPQDVTQHLVVIAAKGDRAAICGSDTSIYSKLQKAIAAEFQTLDQGTMEAAFVGGKAKAIWMSGVHAPTAVKPTAKTLMGDALEYALDPLGDQTFYFSAIRSRVAYSLGGATVEKVLGVAPGQGRVWVGRPKDWAAFVAELEAIVDHAAAPNTPVTLYSSLAKAVPFAGTGNAESVAVMPPDLFSEAEIDDEDREAAVLWAFEVAFSITPSGPHALSLDADWQGLALGRLELNITPGPDVHDITGRWTTAPVDPDPLKAEQQNGLRDAALSLLIERKWIRIYYENGHVLARGRLYLPQFRDQVFVYTPRDFTGYNVRDEKPKHTRFHPLVTAIAGIDANGAQDISLFAYIVEKMFVDANGTPYGWLASDDGSMEFADFVHIDAAQQTVTLVHAKGANSNAPLREVSVSAFEVVVAQAIKNLRHLDHVNLHQALHAGRNRKIKRAVWHDGVRQPNRAGIIRIAKNLPSNFKRRLVVLQPQLTLVEELACNTATASQQRQDRKRRLDTLLHGARATALSVNAEFECCVAM